ncbi:MAG: hypothetical protein Tsb0020_55940 [Haliangiales bacterium]
MTPRATGPNAAISLPRRPAPEAPPDGDEIMVLGQCANIRPPVLRGEALGGALDRLERRGLITPDGRPTRAGIRCLADLSEGAR